jgi:hypothetical protein
MYTDENSFTKLLETSAGLSGSARLPIAVGMPETFVFLFAA